MSEVDFEEQNWSPGRGETMSNSGGFREPSNPKMVGWIIKLGLAKDPKQANYVLTGIAIAIFTTSLIVFLSVG